MFSSSRPLLVGCIITLCTAGQVGCMGPPPPPPQPPAPPPPPPPQPPAEATTSLSSMRSSGPASSPVSLKLRSVQTAVTPTFSLSVNTPATSVLISLPLTTGVLPSTAVPSSPVPSGSGSALLSSRSIEAQGSTTNEKTISPTSTRSADPASLHLATSHVAGDQDTPFKSIDPLMTAMSWALLPSTTYAQPPAEGGGVTWVLVGSIAGLLAMLCLLAAVTIVVSLVFRRREKVSLLKKVVVNNPNYYVPESFPAPKESCCDEYDSVDELGFTPQPDSSSYPINDYDTTSQVEQTEPLEQRSEYYEITVSQMEKYENCSAIGTWKGTSSKECTPDISIADMKRIDSTVASMVSHDSTDKLFFEESDVYWRPACKFEELYQQLSKMKYREIPTSHIRILAQIGSGEFGMVKKGVWSSPAGVREVAVKMLPPDATEKDQIRFLQEAAVNGQFNFHPNIVHLFGVVTVEKPLMMVLELLDNGDLRNYLLTHKALLGKTTPTDSLDKATPTDWPYTLLGFCRHVASGMEYLSSKGFVHRDLAARNILLSEEKICKIADFGMSRGLDDDTYYISQGGKIPVKWTAPEAIHFKKYSSLSDVWSYGALLYEIWSFGQKPFENYTNLEVIRMIDEGIRLGPPPGCPRAIYLLMIQCWHPEKMNRPTFESIVQTLRSPSTDLLHWSSEDLAVHPEVRALGANISVAQDLYPDLHYIYKKCI